MAIKRTITMTNTTSSKHSKSNSPTLGGLQAVGRPWMAQGHKHDVVYRLKKSRSTKASGRASHRTKPKSKNRK